MKPEYNLQQIAGSYNAGRQFDISPGKGVPKPAGFGDKQRKAQGTRVFLYDNKGILLFIFDSKNLAFTTLRIGHKRLDDLLAHVDNTIGLPYAQVSQQEIGLKQGPTMTLEQVQEMVERNSILNPIISNNKGKKKTEAMKLYQANKQGTPIYVYDKD